MGRREELLDQVTDHVLEHGLIGFTLRPVAAAIGTSDRMLIYAGVADRPPDRAPLVVAALPPAPTVRSAVKRLWELYRTEPLSSCVAIYVQAAATGLFGHEPYRSDARSSNERWAAALREYLVRSGAPARRVGRMVALVDSALLGFHLELATERPEELARGVDDLARAVQALAA